MFCTLAYSQELQDTLKQVGLDTKEDFEIKIKQSELQALISDKEMFAKQVEELQMELKTLKTSHADDSLKLAELDLIKVQKIELEKAHEKLEAKYMDAERYLADITSNFLYIPYDAFSVEKVAIKAYEVVTDESLKKEHNIKYRLLKSYQQDIKDLILFMNACHAAFENPFKSSTESDLQALYTNQVYKSYNEYKYWKFTYIGKKLLLIESRLKSFNENSGLDFSDIIAEFDACLKTVEEL